MIFKFKNNFILNTIISQPQIQNKKEKTPKLYRAPYRHFLFGSMRTIFVGFRPELIRDTSVPSFFLASYPKRIFALEFSFVLALAFFVLLFIFISFYVCHSRVKWMVEEKCLFSLPPNGLMWIVEESFSLFCIHRNARDHVTMSEYTVWIVEVFSPYFVFIEMTMWQCQNIQCFFFVLICRSIDSRELWKYMIMF